MSELRDARLRADAADRHRLRSGGKRAQRARPFMTLDEFDDDACLIYGIGNVGRQDDGLGWAFVDWLEARSRGTNAEPQRGYQLLVEDADLISSKRRVLFIDATKDTSVSAFTLERAAPRMDFSFTSH